jgi:hypothetical protein
MDVVLVAQAYSLMVNMTPYVSPQLQSKTITQAPAFAVEGHAHLFLNDD